MEDNFELPTTLTGNVVAVTMCFITSASLIPAGESTENPFEGSANDVPISQMTRAVEIDIREMLGEINLPPALEPRNNIVL